ncbi:MAG: hypothetical protein ABSB49_22625, partial [Polyangia bacterium]
MSQLAVARLNTRVSAGGLCPTDSVSAGGLCPTALIRGGCKGPSQGPFHKQTRERRRALPDCAH